MEERKKRAGRDKERQMRSTSSPIPHMKIFEFDQGLNVLNVYFH